MSNLAQGTLGKGKQPVNGRTVGVLVTSGSSRLDFLGRFGGRGGRSAPGNSAEISANAKTRRKPGECYSLMGGRRALWEQKGSTEQGSLRLRTKDSASAAADVIRASRLQCAAMYVCAREQ